MSQVNTDDAAPKAPPVKWRHAFLWGCVPSVLLAFLLWNSRRLAPAAQPYAVPLVYVAMYAMATAHATVLASWRVNVFAIPLAMAALVWGLASPYMPQVARLSMALGPIMGACLGLRAKAEGPFMHACQGIFGFVLGALGAAAVRNVCPEPIVAVTALFPFTLALAVRCNSDDGPYQGPGDSGDKPWFIR